MSKLRCAIFLNLIFNWNNLIIGSPLESEFMSTPSPLENEGKLVFPKNFTFGAATAAYQIEGAWNLDGKGENIWDTLTHTRAQLIDDHSSGDVAADSYHFFEDDLRAIKEMGLDFYRLSISWNRILSDGSLSSINAKGIEYYNYVINRLLENGIEPVVTMYHYDLPQSIQDLGGFTNTVLVEYFRQYAKVLFKTFGDRVKTWITFNEPLDFCVDGYGIGRIAPNIKVGGRAEYLCGYTVLLAHAAAYHVYQNEFANKYHGKIGITLSSRYFIAKEANDAEAADIGMQFGLGWFAHPLFVGDYPKVMIDRIATNSINENLVQSRLPEFTEAEKRSIYGSADFIGLNYYTTRYAVTSNKTATQKPSWEDDSNIDTFGDPDWPLGKAFWIYSYPTGLRLLLNFIRTNYGNPDVLITENGWSDDGQLNDEGRVTYLKDHLKAVLQALVIDKCNVVGYAHWSLIDNFEWMRGYTEKFGLYQVDFSSPNKTRTAKESSKVYRDIIKTRHIPV